jgi:hypothetical protein
MDDVVQVDIVLEFNFLQEELPSDPGLVDFFVSSFRPRCVDNGPRASIKETQDKITGGSRQI